MELPIPPEFESMSMSDRILNNFYLSYQFSQGDNKFQEHLLVAASQKYQPERLFQEFTSTSSVDASLHTSVMDLRLPRPHAGRGITGNKLDRARIERDLAINWQNQLYVLSKLFFQDDVQNPNPNSIDEILTYQPDQQLLYITQQVIDADLKYLEKGRPHRAKVGQDPYESFFKTYVIDRGMTGSEEFTQLFDEVRVLLSDDSLLRKTIEIGSTGYTTTVEAKLQQLRNTWEREYPGKSFV